MVNNIKKIAFMSFLFGILLAIVCDANAQQVFVSPLFRNKVIRTINITTLTYDTVKVVLEAPFWDSYGGASMTLNETDKMTRYYGFGTANGDSIAASLHIPDSYSTFIGWGVGALTDTTDGSYVLVLKWNKTAPGDTLLDGVSRFASSDSSIMTFTIASVDSGSYNYSEKSLATSNSLNGNDFIQLMLTRRNDSVGDSLKVLFINLMFER